MAHHWPKDLIWHCTVLSLWAIGAVNYDDFITTTIKSLLIGSRCIPNGAHTNYCWANLAHASKCIKNSDICMYIYTVNIYIFYFFIFYFLFFLYFFYLYIYTVNIHIYIIYTCICSTQSRNLLKSAYCIAQTEDPQIALRKPMQFADCINSQIA